MSCVTSDTPDLFMPQEQLLLPLQSAPVLTLADLPGQAFAPVLAALDALCRGEVAQLHVWGEPGAGRSLLVNAFVADASQRLSRVVMLPLRQVVFLPAEMLDGLEHCELVVLDDIEAAAGWPAWEEALFNLYNRLQDSGGRLLVTSAMPPAGLPLQLPDLRSRLARASVYSLPSPSDAVRVELLQATAQRRGWVLEAELQRYLIERGPRPLGRFMALIDRLDQRAQRDKRALSVPLARQLLEETQAR